MIFIKTPPSPLPPVPIHSLPANLEKDAYQKNALIFTLFLLATTYLSTKIYSSILPSCILLVRPHLCSEWSLLYNHQKSDFNSRYYSVAC